MTESHRLSGLLGVVYQIYPRSYQDTNGDGIGDLPGVIARLDYLRWLGVKTIWLSPIFRSPMADFGYDVADYRDVDPIFGNLGDLDRLIEESHTRDLSVVLDYVPNHTSDQHPWFLESRSSRDSARRHWYIWSDPSPGGGPPNNWWNHFDGRPAWTLDEGTGQYYLHLFAPQQPDLNWRNPDVQEAMLDVLRFWLDRGVDGFRVDVVSHLIKDEKLRDEPPGPRFPEAAHPASRTDDQPEVHEIIRAMRDVIDEYDDRLLIGELWVPMEKVFDYYGAGDELHMPFNFALMVSEWSAEAVRSVVERYEGLLPRNAWPNWVIANHDFPRAATRLGREQVRMAMMALLTLRGTPTLYYGEELGLSDVPIPPERLVDPQGRDDPERSRDPARTSMPWTRGANAGFCDADVEPWLPVGEDNAALNVEAQRDDPDSMLTLTRELIGLRISDPDIQLGKYQTLEAPDDVFAFRRGDSIIVTLNFSSRTIQWRPPDRAEVVMSTHLDRGGSNDAQLDLRPHEGVILRTTAHSVSDSRQM